MPVKDSGIMGYQEGMDDLEEYPVGVRVLILAAQVKASANLATWLFLGQGEMFFFNLCA